MDDQAESRVQIYCGSLPLCHEYSLVLESKGFDHAVEPAGELWAVYVSAPVVVPARDEIERYAGERKPATLRSRFLQPQPGAGLGAAGYAAVLLSIAFAAGRNQFGADWFSLGAVDSSAGEAHAWWRAVTALTLHADQAHLLGNLLFGMVAGSALARLVGPGVAWSGVLAAAALANVVEMSIAPPAHRAIGASTAVFAALGLLTGMAWGERILQRQQRWYRWAPLIAGSSLLTLFGAGAEHVDVLGHLLGFFFGTLLGWMFAHTPIPRLHHPRVQALLGACTVLAICVAWVAALHGS